MSCALWLAASQRMILPVMVSPIAQYSPYCARQSVMAEASLVRPPA